ncbi:MAG TPA: hypothetical protein VM600_04675, partial [Actinomycetota bacterium]|nr:hypothetical protein [Actinomycetota bacterium]
LGAALVLTAWTLDAISIALGANAVAAIFHAWSHIADRGQGGRASDPLMMSLVAVFFIALFARRIMRRQTEA